MRLTEGLAMYLTAQGIGTYDPDGSSDIFVDWVPDGRGVPAEIVALLPEQGPPGDIAHGWDVEGVRIYVRGSSQSPKSAADRAQRIYDALQGLGELKLPNGLWVLYVRLQTPGLLDRDEQSRHRYIINGEAEVRRVTAHRSAG